METSEWMQVVGQFVMLRRFRRAVYICACLTICWVLWQWMSKDSRPYSAIWCKNRLPEILWRSASDKDAALASYGIEALSLEDEYFHFVKSSERMCSDQRHFGPSEDGGWEVCFDAQFRFKEPCLVYSFGIDHDFRFEKGIENSFGCEVHAFDPSMGESSHKYSENGYFHSVGISNIDGYGAGGKWRLKKLSTLMKELKHTDKNIDYLKMDVEFSEWPALHEMITSGTIHKVRQIAIETHTPEVDIHQFPENKCTWSKVDTLAAMLKILIDLRNIGFSVYYTRTNYRTEFVSGLTQKKRQCCNNIHMVNMKHPLNRWIPPPQPPSRKIRYKPTHKS